MNEEKQQLGQILSEYQDVVLHYKNYSFASRGAIKPGEQRTYVYTKVYSGTKSFIAWTDKIRLFLENSSIAHSAEAKDILTHIDSFKGIDEERKIEKLYTKLCVLNDNMELISSSIHCFDSCFEKDCIQMPIPKIEFSCRNKEKSIKIFTLRNVSSMIISNIHIDLFDLISVDGSKQSLLNGNITIPTSLSPNQQAEFSVNHRFFGDRGVGFKEFVFAFFAEDEKSNLFRCVATKNVEDRHHYMIGLWETRVEVVHNNSFVTDTKKREIMKPTVFLSYNWGSDSTADEVEQRLSPIATVLRDKSSICPWGSIGEFMRKIRQTDLVVVIISDAYLKSVNCLYEVIQLLKDENWVSHSMFLVEDSAKGIYKAIGQLEYIDHWEKEYNQLKAALEGKNPALIISQGEELKKIQLIQLNINDFMKSVTDRNNPDLNQAIRAVEKRVKESASGL